MSKVTKEHREAALTAYVADPDGEPLIWERRWALTGEHDIYYSAPLRRLACIAQAITDAEQRGAQRERARATKWLRSKPMIGSHHMAADELEAGKHRESEDE